MKIDIGSMGMRGEGKRKGEDQGNARARMKVDCVVSPQDQNSLSLKWFGCKLPLGVLPWRREKRVRAGGGELRAEG